MFYLADFVIYFISENNLNAFSSKVDFHNIVTGTPSQ